jgi:hypothetical protein
MLLNRLRKAQTPRRPELYVRPTLPNFWQLQWIGVLLKLYGENHVLARAQEDLQGLARGQLLFQLERNRRAGNTRDLPCSSAFATECWIGEERIVELGGGVVRPAVRGQGLIVLPTACAMCSGILCDDSETLAIVSVTTRQATSAQRALIKIGARCIDSEASADALHPKLGVYYRRIQRIGRDQKLSDGDALLWVFSSAAVRLMIAYVLQAAEPDGMPWVLDDGKTIHVIVEGFLADPEVGSVLGRMVFGMSPLPVKVLPDN